MAGIFNPTLAEPTGRILVGHRGGTKTGFAVYEDGELSDVITKSSDDDIPFLVSLKDYCAKHSDVDLVVLALTGPIVGGKLVPPTGRREEIRYQEAIELCSHAPLMMVHDSEAAAYDAVTRPMDELKPLWGPDEPGEMGDYIYMNHGRGLGVGHAWQSDTGFVVRPIEISHSLAPELHEDDRIIRKYLTEVINERPTVQMTGAGGRGLISAWCALGGRTDKPDFNQDQIDEIVEQAKSGDDIAKRAVMAQVRHLGSLLSSLVLLNVSGGIRIASPTLRKYSDYYLELGLLDYVEHMQLHQNYSQVTPIGVFKTDRDFIMYGAGRYGVWQYAKHHAKSG